MSDLAILFVHFLATIAKLMRPGGGRAVVVESLLLKHQLMVLNQGHDRAPNLRPMDRVLAGLYGASVTKLLISQEVATDTICSLVTGTPIRLAGRSIGCPSTWAIQHNSSKFSRAKGKMARPER